ncbi:putative PurR-regulated permease PerM [Diaminobutyricimonas aerilata]|uniref:Putative PurR-regulated permease PerM n=1 Tax=Diaminobutyricimonas aerilata TaxID=1162967 RepID=A0A2M9CI04_9MICO|nr:AI-2E family transporter [Diaminobutyricimonas aerilata]PJJ71499.1 putative PurR-regulated permease PerM [Diaminobutyricimonas aerilata]
MIFGRRGQRASARLERGRAVGGTGPGPVDGALNGTVPPAMVIAGAWAWRLLAVAAVIGVLVWLVIQLRDLVVPVLVAVLLAALLVPFSNFLQRHRWPKWLAVAVSEIGIIAVITGLIWLVVTQVRAGFPDLQRRTMQQFEVFREWLRDSPLDLTDADLNRYIDQGFAALQTNASTIATGALSVGSTAGHFITGMLLVLFATLFILIDGRGIWNWIVRLFPRRARVAVNGSGEAGWHTLSTFVRVQIFVAFVDAVGIGLGAWILGLFFGGFPLVIPISVAVFLGSFVPVVGAVITGAFAVVVALVFLGPVPALIMLGIVLLVQQIEGHILQPLIMGAAVRVHPLAVVLAVAAGGFLAGIPGTLFAVPIVAVLNVMVKYIASGAWRVTAHPDEQDVATRV